MLHFFRKMRKALVPENRFGRYFFYALGEIVLVVIGILIALQVNNKNEYRKARKFEVNILKEIKNNLVQDLHEIQSDISIMDSVNLACDNIIISLTKEIRSHTLKYNVAKLSVNPHFDPNKSGYELMVSKGVDIIQNDSLRQSISQLYESAYTYYYRYEEERTQFLLLHLEQKLNEYFSREVKPELMFFSVYNVSESDLSRLKKDESFKKLVSAVKLRNEIVKNRAQRIAGYIEKLIDQLEMELKLKNE